MRNRLSGRYALAMVVVLVLGIPAVAVGAGEGRALFGGKRNPVGGGSLTRETQVIEEIVASEGFIAGRTVALDV